MPFIIIFIVTMLSSVTNLIWVSPWIAVLSPFSLLLLGDERFRFLLWPVFSMLGYCFFWTCIYDPYSFFELDFFRRDGNIFVSWGVFLGAVLLGKFTILNCRLFRNVLLLVSLVFSMISLLWVYLGTASVFGSEGTSFLFLANNAAGGYLATVISMLVPYIYSRQKGVGWSFLCILAGLSLLVALWMTYSRGSLVGLLVVPVWFNLFKKIKLRSIALILGVLSLIIGTFTYVSNGSLGDASADELRADTSLIEEYGFLGAGAKASNVATRVNHLWSGASACFWSSPIFGVGFGSYDDRPWVFSGIPHLLSINTSGIVIHSDSHAHNSYLNFLAEGGLIMFILMLLVIGSIERLCRSANSVMADSLLCGLCCIIVASASEHRFTTPSQMIPFCVMLGWACSSLLTKKYSGSINFIKNEKSLAHF
jgi:O-antigen ligase